MSNPEVSIETFSYLSTQPPELKVTSLEIWSFREVMKTCTLPQNVDWHMKNSNNSHDIRMV